jgi:hypothetical protein
VLVPLVTAILFAGSSPAPRTAELHYERSAGAESCPDAAGIERAVIQRLGYDPFTAGASRTIRAQMLADGRALRSRIQIEEAANARTGAREITSASGNCAELAASTALAIAIAIDPLALTRPPGVAPPERHEPEPRRSTPRAREPSAEIAAPDAGYPTEPIDQPQPEPEPPPKQQQASPEEPEVPLPSLESKAPPTPPADPPVQQPVREPLRTTLEAGPFLAVALAPSTSIGLHAGARVRYGRASLGLEAWADVPGSAPLPEGTVNSQFFAGALIPCLHRDPFSACAVVTAGALLSRSEGITQPSSATTPLFGIGPRLTGEFLFSEAFSLLASLDVLARPMRVSLLVDDREVWISPAFSVVTSLAVSFHLE